MSFVAAIEQAQNIATWAKACLSLASVSDQIQFCVAESSITIRAVNMSRTALGQVTFDAAFFGHLEALADPESFLVSSKHMAMLFRTLDAAKLEYVCLVRHDDPETPPSRRHKLSVEVYTKGLVLKKYQLGLLPAQGGPSTIPAHYEALLAQGQVHHFVIDTQILKLFLDMVPAATLDFVLEAKATKVSFSAFNKNAAKDRDYLKQPMAITIQMAIDELEDSNLSGTDAAVTFRLKDFNNYVALVSAIKTPVAHDDEPLLPLATEAMFASEGAPIVFRSSTPSVLVQFIQITAEDPENADSKTAKDRFALHQPVALTSAGLWSKETPPAAKRQKLLPADSKKLSVQSFSSATVQSLGTGTSGSSWLDPGSPDLDRAPTDYSSDEHELGPTQGEPRPTSLFD